MKTSDEFIKAIEAREEAEGEISDDAVEAVAGGDGEDSGEARQSRRNPNLPLMTREEIYETYGKPKQP